MQAPSYKQDELLLQYIGVGRENAVTRKELERLTGQKDRVTRKQIERLRMSGKHTIVNLSNGAGYFIPDKPAEVRRYIKQESSRARSTYAGLRGARRLLKQMEEAENDG